MNPTATLKGIKVKDDNGKVKDFSASEMEAILEAARSDKDKRIYPLALLLRYSGLRISDATMLHKDALKGDHTHRQDHQDERRGIGDTARVCGESVEGNRTGTRWVFLLEP